MNIIESLFTGASAILIGIVLGFIIAGIIGVVVWGLVGLRNRMKNEDE